MSKVFGAKQYCKMSDLFRLLALRLSARKSEIKKKTLIISTRTRGQIQKSCMPEIIFSKKEFQI